MADQKLVYVVDDDPAMRRSLARLLHHLGYDSLLFPSPEAIAAHRGFDKPLCVLLDINLGPVSGIELKKRFDTEGIKVPVVFMTGNDSPAVREAALQSGCIAYLTKPFSTTSLNEALERAAALAGRRK